MIVGSEDLEDAVNGLMAGSAYFVGIGGIGVSALAQWFHADGWDVSGTDRVRSEITDGLEHQGISCTIPESSALPPNVNLLVYSDAVPPAHPLRVAAGNQRIRSLSYASALGELTEPFRTIAVSGSHGKSTTTALAGLMLEAAGKDPTVVVGTRVPQWERNGAVGGRQSAVGNFRGGRPVKAPRKGPWPSGLYEPWEPTGPSTWSAVAVVEADEYRKHFLTLSPAVAVVTSVDYDHVDAFPTPESYHAAFAEFVQLVGPGGTVVLPAQDAAAANLRSSVNPTCTVATFAVSEQKDAADVVATPPVVRNLRQEFRLTVRGRDWGGFALAQPGEHVVRNATAAIAAVLPFGVEPDAVRRALLEFLGTWRRFELVGEVNGAPVISDYAHHPTELRALHAAARQRYPGRRLVIAFQPHQHARAKAFADQFVEALRSFDVVILAEVYDVAGREERPPTRIGDSRGNPGHGRVSTLSWVEQLRAAGREATYAASLEDVARVTEQRASPHDVVLVVGAGDIDPVARRLART